MPEGAGSSVLTGGARRELSRAIMCTRNGTHHHAHGIRRARGRSGMSASASVVLLAQSQPEHGLPQKAVEIATPLGFPITNSMVITWLVAIRLVAVAQIATRRMAVVTDMAIPADKMDETKVEEARALAAARLSEKISDEEVASVNASLALRSHNCRSGGGAAGKSVKEAA